MGKTLVTHYDNLKVARDSPPEVIRAAYRALAQKYHPDRYPDRTGATRIMQIINAAYEVLSDPERRRAHDAWIAEEEARASSSEGRRASWNAEVDAGNFGQERPTTPSTAASGAGGQPAYEARRDRDGAGSPGWLRNLLFVIIAPFVVGAMLVQRIYLALRWCARELIYPALRWFGRLIGIAVIATVVIAVLTRIMSAESPPQSPPRQPSVRSLQDEIRELVQEGQKTLPRKITEEIRLVAIAEAQGQLIRTFDIVGMPSSAMTSAVVREMREEMAASFRAACPQPELRALLERGMSFAQVYRMADTGSVVLTVVQSIKDC